MEAEYDCAIIGGGLAGLALSILLARQQKKVILFEKEQYPFHKVCGEFISNESVPFLKTLGLDLSSLDLPKITKLLLSSAGGTSLERPLDIGGTGLSRSRMDLELSRIASANGVAVHTNSKVQKFELSNDKFMLTANDHQFNCRTVVGAFGKNSNIDVQLGRKYKAPDERHHFVAVKHHVRLSTFDPARVEMHIFNGGYCGMSAIEDGLVNLSYITRAGNLKKHGNIRQMEKSVLSRNPFLAKYFAEAQFMFDKPLTISNLYFSIKDPVHSNVLMLGDAAGNIAPLSGNGMSMALKSSKLASKHLIDFLDGKINRQELEQRYTASYHGTFTKRIRSARQINWLFVHPVLSDLVFPLFKAFPGLIDSKSKSIHGEVF